jgi:hypothetical protein
MRHLKRHLVNKSLATVAANADIRTDSHSRDERGQGIGPVVPRIGHEHLGSRSHAHLREQQQRF